MRTGTGMGHGRGYGQGEGMARTVASNVHQAHEGMHVLLVGEGGVRLRTPPDCSARDLKPELDLIRLN